MKSVKILIKNEYGKRKKLIKKYGKRKKLIKKCNDVIIKNILDYDVVYIT